jgi:hypothetical protein
MYGMLAAPTARGQHALKAIRILTVVVQQTTQPRERGESVVSWLGGRAQLSGDLSDRIQMDGEALPANPRIGIRG